MCWDPTVGILCYKTLKTLKSLNLKMLVLRFIFYTIKNHSKFPYLRILWSEIA